MVSEMNPLDRYLEEKKAGWLGEAWQGAKQVGSETLGGKSFGGEMAHKGLALGGTALTLLGVMGAQKLYDAATKSHDFKNMLEVNPDLKVKHEENPQMFNQMFSTLRTFNPSFSRDPVVAGSYLRHMMDDPVHAGDVATNALTFRTNTRNPLMDKFLDQAMKPQPSFDTLGMRKRELEGKKLEHELGTFDQRMGQEDEELAHKTKFGPMKREQEGKEIEQKGKLMPQRFQQEEAELGHKGKLMPGRFKQEQSDLDFKSWAQPVQHDIDYADLIHKRDTQLGRQQKEQEEFGHAEELRSMKHPMELDRARKAFEEAVALAAMEGRHFPRPVPKIP